MPDPEPSTLSDLVFHVREHQAGRTPLVVIRRRRAREELTTGELIDAIHCLALALEDQGLAAGDRVAIWAPNQPEWQIVDFACQVLGLVSVPLTPDLPPERVAWVLRNSGSRWVFYAGAERGAVLATVAKGLASPLRIAAMDDAAEGLTGLLGEGHELKAGRSFELLRGRPQPDDPATIVYTAGTTGDPKGVVLSHRNLISTALGCARLLPVGAGDVALSFLPLAHPFERSLTLFWFYRGLEIHYCDAVEQVPTRLREVRPTALAAVPRVYDRAIHRLRRHTERRGGLAGRLVRWSLEVGARHHAARERGLVGPILALQRALAHRLVFRRVAARFGGRLRLAISGGAALERSTAELFLAAGLPVYQAYGTSEAPLVAVNGPGAHRPGSVGRPLPGTQVRIALDGEVLVRGAGVMQGYWQDSAATAAAIDPEAWLHTGDLGRLDDEGFLWITGRRAGG